MEKLTMTKSVLRKSNKSLKTKEKVVEIREKGEEEEV